TCRTVDGGNMNIEEALQENFPVFTSYIEHLSQIGVVLLSEEGTIQDCNQGFLQALGLPTKPVGRKITELCSPDNRVLLLPQGKDYMPVNFQFLGNGDFQISFAGYIFPVKQGYLTILERHQLTYSEVMTKMSILNNQLADLTRDLSKKNQELKAANIRIKKIMNTDPLTGLTNRRSFRKMLQKHMAFARRHRLPLSLIMIDIDHFKAINDNFGHNVGDQILKKLARILRQSCRIEDIVARFGGEEFVVLLSKTDAPSASSWAERVRTKIKKTRMVNMNQKVTASFGIAEFLSSDTEESLIKRADEALYEAKRRGRNCWVVAQVVNAGS
ncbi:MAG: sensor domain-containing diguanylate cyclase, partial [bacterium]